MPIVLLLTAFSPKVSAASFDQQINQLKTTNTPATTNKQQLSREAASLSGTIAQLQAEIATLDGQIGQTTTKVDGLKQNIATAEQDLAGQRTLLALNVRKMYTEQNVTTLEMLASSHNFSHFIDQEQYRSSLQEKIDATTDRITKLMDQLEGEKQSVEDLLADQKAMQDNLGSRRTESARLLGLNQQQQAAFQASVNANAEKIAKLERDQANQNKKGLVSQPAQTTLNAVAPQAPSGTSYPWANVPFPNSMPDPWGMYKRQCVSYTAWKVANSGRHMPYWGGRGNAKNWDNNARAAGIPTDNSPRVGDVAISNAGTYGHAMYVEAVHGDGTITVSQYNADWQGNYSVSRRSAAALAFIHF